MTRLAVCAGALCALLATDLSTATAGGMFLPTRGVRPTARGGAFVAGADDLGALYFNPAGLANMAGGAMKQALVDVAYVAQSVTYTRVDSGFNGQDTVENEGGGLPIPTVALGVDLSDDLIVTGGVFAPFASLGQYPNAGPQRYSMVDLSDTLIVITEVAVGWRVTDKLRVGAGVQNMFVNLVSEIVFNGCPGQTVCAPEDPEFDSLSQVSQRDYFVPSGVVGVQYDAHDKVRLGAAFQLPYRISGKGDLKVKLPSSGFFDGASVSGDKGTMSLTLPAMLRMGVEVEPAKRTRVEVDVAIEFWSMHDELSVEPDDVRIEDAPGVGSYEVGDIIVPREFDNTVSAHIGVETQPSASSPLTLAVGYAYETAASPDEFLSVLTVDGTKHLIGGGVGYKFGKTQVYASGSIVSVADREVTSEEGRAPQLTPIRDDTQGAPLETFVNWGTYSSSWFTAGLSVSSEF